MHRVVGVSRDGASVTEFSFRDTGQWLSTEEAGDFPVEGGNDYARRIAVVLIGDGEAGPVISLGYRPPSNSPPEKFPAHGHDSDTWRVPLLGQTSMGQKTFQRGEFRFWPGGRPYGSDDAAWGPDGGWNVTIAGDRRGVTMRTVDKTLQGQADATAANFAMWLGFSLPTDPPGVPGLSTTLETSSRAGNSDGAFAGSAEWPVRVPGVRAHVGLFGDHHLGPIMMLSRWDPGARPGVERFGTEVLHLVVEGSARLGRRELGPGDIHLITADRSHPEITVGSEGFCAITIFGDRSQLGDRLEQDWARWLSSVVLDLEERLPQRPVRAM